MIIEYHRCFLWLTELTSVRLSELSASHVRAGLRAGDWRSFLVGLESHLRHPQYGAVWCLCKVNSGTGKTMKNRNCIEWKIMNGMKEVRLQIQQMKGVGQGKSSTIRKSYSIWRQMIQVAKTCLLWTVEICELRKSYSSFITAAYKTSRDKSKSNTVDCQNRMFYDVLYFFEEHFFHVSLWNSS